MTTAANPSSADGLRSSSGEVTGVSSSRSLGASHPTTMPAMPCACVAASKLCIPTPGMIVAGIPFPLDHDDIELSSESGWIGDPGSPFPASPVRHFMSQYLRTCREMKFGTTCSNCTGCVRNSPGNVPCTDRAISEPERDAVNEPLVFPSMLAELEGTDRSGMALGEPAAKADRGLELVDFAVFHGCLGRARRIYCGEGGERIGRKLMLERFVEDACEFCHRFDSESGIPKQLG
ncbi:hypothetical protein BDK51DRAFT_26963 [Blyttiomyces helicus]|uniref:Uncharacterized protein n=1 Tax=Blyttiomyces helicus TaxID=388810 RepID=A0A4P9W842_9FUNG|nr:hypothetical protein BDK51DRAFT_26963 [Blyttiomyces helicus]|eukprot:RKO88681.1 hypothetical protein BDK51DRAFT_26963 [Blyttiomyces helicus]